MKNRGNEDMQRRRNEGETDIDRLRRWEVDGQPRQNTVEDLAMATEIRGTAEDIRRDRATNEQSKKPEKEPSPTVTQGAENEPQYDRIADLRNKVDV